MVEADGNVRPQREPSQNGMIVTASVDYFRTPVQFRAGPP